MIRLYSSIQYSILRNPPRRCASKRVDAHNYLYSKPKSLQSLHSTNPQGGRFTSPLPPSMALARRIDRTLHKAPPPKSVSGDLQKTQLFFVVLGVKFDHFGALWGPKMSKIDAKNTAKNKAAFWRSPGTLWGGDFVRRAINSPSLSHGGG